MPFQQLTRLKGQIDNIRIYNKALSDAEVTSIFPFEEGLYAQLFPTADSFGISHRSTSGGGEHSL